MHYTPDSRRDVLDNVLHQNVRLSEVIFTDILGSHHLPITFSIIDPVRMRKALDPVEKLTDWVLFQSLAFDLTFPNI
jgi:hypothetical protein